VVLSVGCRVWSVRRRMGGILRMLRMLRMLRVLNILFQISKMLTKIVTKIVITFVLC